ncbi:MAG: CPBP family intramembrane glutamic endopeptidase, partial [Candidatus Eiseniibacteriota bacterium]
MPIALDHLLAFVLVVLFPVRAALFGYRRLTAADPADVPRVRLWLYRQGIAIQWTLAVATVVLWAYGGRPWAALGVVPKLTWGLVGVAVGLAIVVAYVLVQRARALEDDDALAGLRRQLRNLERMMPRSDEEMHWFDRLAVTAGICEELLYRGYLIWYLDHWLALTPAVLLASVVFGFGHAYQGPRGVAVTTMVGLFLGAIYLLTGSLAAGMVFHTLMDMHAGRVARAALA